MGEETHSGIMRVMHIVQNLKDFSKIDSENAWLWADLNKEMDSTLEIIGNELSNKACVVKIYGVIPEIQCLPSQLNQVFLNILQNAAHAIEHQGTITVRTGAVGEQVYVEIADTGSGISPENVRKIFDPFFTTKSVGKGTGLGLSLCYGIVQKHHGAIEVSSVLGQGAAFKIWLPIQQIQGDVGA